MLMEEIAAIRLELGEERNNRKAYQDLAVVALESVAQLTQRNKQLAERIDALNKQLRQLMTGQRVDDERDDDQPKAAA
jgi:hypothetical protein